MRQCTSGVELSAYGECLPKKTGGLNAGASRAERTQLQALGIPAPAVTEIPNPIDETEFAGHEWHSDVERVSEESLYGFVRFLWSAVVGIAASE